LKKHPVMCCCLALFLGACNRVAGDMQARLDGSLADVLAYEPGYPTYNKEYYSYYIEPSIGRLEADTTSNLFVVNGSQVLMRVNVSSVVNEKYYRSADSEDDPLASVGVIAESSGTYIDFLGDDYDYVVWLRKLDDRMVVQMNAGYMEFSSITYEEKAIEVASAMLEIARSVKVNKNEVLADYAISETINYVGKQVALFDEMAPESGTLEELFSESRSGTGQNLEEMVSGTFPGDDPPEEETSSETPGKEASDDQTQGEAGENPE